MTTDQTTTKRDGPSDDSIGPDNPPHGRPFNGEWADQGDNRWQAYRRDILKDHGLWERWRAVPPEHERTKPLETYLPGGVNYE